jgi:hypothetical protein
MWCKGTVIALFCLLVCGPSYAEQSASDFLKEDKNEN